MTRPDPEFQAEVDAISGSTWVEKLHYTYDNADSTKRGGLTLEEWLKSKMRFLVSDCRLTDAQLIDFYHRIDANCDMLIQWDEIVSFLLVHGSDTAHQTPTHAKLKPTFEGPRTSNLRKTMRTTRILRTLYLPTQDFIVTISETTLTAWRVDDCNPVHIINDRDAFVDCALVGPIARIAVAKANRQIIFFDVRTFKLTSLIVSATLVASAIPTLDLEQSQRAIVGGHYRDIPMFNVPTTIYGHPDRAVLYVGDCDGRIEVFEFFTGGVKRISDDIYEEIRGVLRHFLENVIRDSVTYTEHARRETVTALDVVYALKRQGKTLYGF
jgi:hypothetical protein